MADPPAPRRRQPPCQSPEEPPSKCAKSGVGDNGGPTESPEGSGATNSTQMGSGGNGHRIAKLVNRILSRRPIASKEALQRNLEASPINVPSMFTGSEIQGLCGREIISVLGFGKCMVMAMVHNMMETCCV